ncbi:formylglycine-generating enzyme family protein [Lacihabitans lacunae]|uniref:Formylglycine-generating enzyme family protein n=1 Tax=Lacihabitans lacunae TaxID=1028214 RepID=A0ABV7Z0J4_9BACT
MKYQFYILFLFQVVFLISCKQESKNEELILVKGGAFKNSRTNFSGSNITIPDFYIGKHEVSQKEWNEIMGKNPSKFKGDNLPVETVTWYDCIAFCNKKSQKEGLVPYYTLDTTKTDLEKKDEKDNLKWLVGTNQGANGYRLPTTIEWEYAASGGQLSKDYIYSGSNDAKEAGWFYANSGDKELLGFWNWSEIQKNNCKTKPISSKISNELGLFNMSGNVKEWCYGWHALEGETVKERPWKGGGWAGADFCTEIAYEGSYVGNSKGEDQGLRLCKNK